MYLRQTRTGYRGTEQWVGRAPFLLLVQPKQDSIANTCCASNTYALVRSVALRQCGQWMMGSCRIKGKTYSVSGSYGSDGLPMTIDSLPDDAVLLPADLYKAWSKGEGWNGAGNEADAMRTWAKETFK